VTYAAGVDVTAVTWTVVVAIVGGARLVGSVGPEGSAGHYIAAFFEGDSRSRLNLGST
jgi:hypothetical protein